VRNDVLEEELTPRRRVELGREIRQVAPFDDVGAHFPRGAPLVTAGGLVFAATAQDRQLRAYDRDTGDVVWSYTLPGGSEGIPATYEVGGRQYLAVPVAAGAGLFAPLLDPAPNLPPLERAYIVFALPRG
jgi:quinoprotein glucose dehydrogenase